MPEAPFQKTWKVGDPVLAADLNTNIRDGYLYQLQNRPAARAVATPTTGVTTAVTGTWTVINFALADQTFDIVDNTFSIANRFDCVVPGLYLVTGCVSWANNATGGRAIRFTINGTAQIGIKSCQATPAGGIPTALTMTRLLYMTKADILRMEGFQTSGGNLNTNTANGECSSLQVLFVTSGTGIR